VLVDVLWLLSIETEGRGDDSSARKRLIELIHRVHTNAVVPAVMLKERLDVQIMAKAGVIPNSQHFIQRAIRINTRDLYGDRPAHTFLHAPV